MDNLRAALAWSLHAGEVELGLRIAAALRWGWESVGSTCTSEVGSMPNIVYAMSFP